MPVFVEILNTGTELMLGNTLNTHHQWLARQLYPRGYVIRRQTSVPDTGAEIQQAVREALGRADILITTGGLGPTSDDVTRDLIAQLLGKPLRLDAAVLSRIEAFYAARRRPMPVTTRVQAMVPEGACVLNNDQGTAPGLAIILQPNPFRPEVRTSGLVMLPGPPRELRPMFQQRALPWLLEKFPVDTPPMTRILRTTGLGESVIEEKVAPRLQALIAEGLELGYCAQMGQVDLRLVAYGPPAGPLVSTAEALIRQELGAAVFAEGDELLESVVIRLLREHRSTVALAESCTGGLISHRLTNVPGASNAVLAGCVTYSNAAKQDLLGVLPETLAQHGAVSEAVAREMAEGARRRFGSDYALSVTGIAGPAGGSEAKPVGTVFLGLAQAQPTEVRHQFYPVDRETFKLMVSQQALDMLRSALLRSTDRRG